MNVGSFASAGHLGLTTLALLLAPACDGAPVLTSGRHPASRPEAAESPATIDAGRLHADVEFLAAKTMRGRGVGTPENARAAEWIAERFEKLGLEPACNGSWFHEFRLGDKACRNVAGLLRVDGADEYVIIAAHHDHLGVRGKSIFRGADDNASGVAGVLALARVLAERRTELRRNLVFVSFDAEESGLIGSKRFVASGVIPTEKTVFMLVFDLIGGHFLPGEENSVYALGSEHSAAVRRVLLARSGASPLKTRILGTYVIEPAGPLFARSDYAAYRQKRVPYLFVSTATPWYYHTPYDTPDRLDYEKMASIVRLSRDVVFDMARFEGRPDFEARSKPEVREAREIAIMLQGMLDAREQFRLGRRAVTELEARVAALHKMVDAGRVTDRGKRQIQRALITVLGVARRLRKKTKRAK